MVPQFFKKIHLENFIRIFYKIDPAESKIKLKFICNHEIILLKNGIQILFFNVIQILFSNPHSFLLCNMPKNTDYFEYANKKNSPYSLYEYYLYSAVVGCIDLKKLIMKLFSKTRIKSILVKRK
jgi:hypothetical protein